MKRFLLSSCLLLMLSVSLFASKQEMLQTVQQQGIAQELSEAPDGVSIRLMDDGGFQIFAVGTGTYDFDDVDELQDAQREAELKAKANLAKFMNESLSTDEKLETMSSKVKKLSAEDGASTAVVDKETSKKTLSAIRSSSCALLKGVITLSTSKVPGAGTTGTCRVMIGVSSKTLEAVRRLSGALAVREVEPAAAAPEQPAAPVEAVVLPPGWIQCIGQGETRGAAVSAALLEGIQQVYGVALKQDMKLIERMKRFKFNSNSFVLDERDNEGSILTKSGGFIKEYRIVSVREIAGGLQEACVYAHIINPRAGGITGIMVYPPVMSLSESSSTHQLGPKRHVSGSDIVVTVGEALCRAFVNSNKFFILDASEMNNIIQQQEISKGLVDAGLAPTMELMKAGQLLTADYILTSSIKDLKYSRTIGMDKKTKKFGPVYKMSMVITYKLTDVTQGGSVHAGTLTVVLSNEEIASLLAADEDSDLLQALMAKVSAVVGEIVPTKQ